MTRFKNRFISVVLLMLSGTLLLAGEYQQTKDGKTMVWNNKPEAGDVAAWFGDRDSDGYANGPGTLTWYTSKGTIYGRYFGNMVRGKFDGPVNVHSEGKTAHALFAEGKRATRWSAGRAPSRMRVASAKPALATPNNQTAENPAAASIPEKHEAQAQNNAPARPLAAGADIPAEGPTEAQRPQPPVPVAKLNSAKNRPVPTNPGRTAPKTKVEFDDSLRTLVGPPTGLRSNPSNPATAPGENAGSSSPGASTQLTPDKVIELADTEARTQGYEPGRFERADPQYDAAANTWSLDYRQKPLDGANETGAHFTVNIDDKTSKVSVMPGR